MERGRAAGRPPSPSLEGPCPRLRSRAAAAYTERVETGGTSLAVRPRAFVGVSGPEAADYLQRMLSNDVEGLAVGASCQALLLTPKARVIAPLRVLRRGENDFLLLTEPELGETVRSHLVRSRFAARADIEPEEHESVLILGDDAEPPEGALALENDDYGTTAFELLDPPAPEAPTRGKTGVGDARGVGGVRPAPAREPAGAAPDVPDESVGGTGGEVGARGEGASGRGQERVGRGPAVGGGRQRAQEHPPQT